MADAKDPPTFLRRWSQRKLAAAREVAPAPPVPAPAAPPAPAATPAHAAPSPSAQAAAPPAEPPPPLPDVASLTFDSDFGAFLSPKVDEVTRRAALRKLFADPRFNVMDGLDVYIDDYSKFEPVTPDVLAKLEHARYLFDPPKTRVNEHGYVEDVVDEPPAQEPAAEGGAAGAGAADAEEGVAPARAPAIESGADDGAPPPPDAGTRPEHAAAALPASRGDLPESGPERPLPDTAPSR